jgi:hypothetical protein
MPAGYSIHRPMPTDAKLDAMRANLYTALTPEWYGNGSEAAVLQLQIRKYLEARNAQDRINAILNPTDVAFPFEEVAA